MKEKLVKSYDYLFAALVLMLPFSMAAPNILLALIIIVFLLRADKQLFGEIKSSPYIFYFAFTAFLIVNVLFRGSPGEARYFSLFLVIGAVPVLMMRVTKLRLLKIAALIAINLSVLLSLIKVARYFNAYGYFPFTQGWAVNFVLWLERPYAGVMSLMSIIISADLIRNSRRKWIYILSMLVSCAFIVLISARMSIITAVVLAMIYILFYLRIKAWKKIAVCLGTVLIFMSVLLFYGKLTTRFFIEDNLEKTLATVKEQEPRTVIWKCAMQMAAGPGFNILTGYGSFLKVRQNYVDCYSQSIVNESRREWFVSKELNSHNQYIDIFLVTGIIGIAIFALFILGLFHSCRQDFFALAIVVTFTLFLIVENVFYRQFGAYIFSIFTGLYLRGIILANEKD